MIVTRSGSRVEEGHPVHIMAYIFQCTQTTKWKPSNLALQEWEVQQFDYAQKEPHDMVAPHLFVKVSKYACGDEPALPKSSLATIEALVLIGIVLPAKVFTKMRLKC